ncbi:MAG: cytochrome c3 family protein [Gammaproteobacteria bacterium]
MNGRWTLVMTAVAMATAFTLAGCDGDDGRDGLPGGAGDPGLACWDLNENGIKDFPDEDTNGDGVIDVLDCRGTDGTAGLTKPVEACAVCHSEGSIGDAVASHALPPIEAVSNVAFAVNGDDLDVTFDLAVDGSAADYYDQIQRGYRTDGTTRITIVDSLTLTNNGGGSYTITVAGGAADAATDSRYLFRVAAGDDRETRVYFYGDFPASPFEPTAVTAEACTNCHGPEGIDIHGGYYAATDGGEPCLVCHGVDDVPILGAVAHEYHSGLLDEITYPTYMNNCSVCHQTEDQLAAVNAMPIIAGACFSCHGSIEGIPFSEATASLHASFTEETNCQQCHAADGIASGVVAVTDVHNGATTERGGIIWDGVDTSVTEGAKIAWEIRRPGVLRRRRGQPEHPAQLRPGRGLHPRHERRQRRSAG